jgi:hypothetical protein
MQYLFLKVQPYGPIIHCAERLYFVIIMLKNIGILEFSLVLMGQYLSFFFLFSGVYAVLSPLL